MNQQHPSPTRIFATDNVQISNKMIEARFTHLSPDVITVNVWKFLFCALAALQKTEHHKNAVRDMRNPFDLASTHHDIRGEVAKHFQSNASRTVTLRMQDIANLIIGDKKGTHVRGDNTPSKKYKRSDIQATCFTASSLHMSTHRRLNSLDDWAAHRSATFTESHDPFDSPLIDWFEWHGEHSDEFVGYLFDAIKCHQDKPWVTVQFSLSFLQAALTTVHYTTFELSHLSQLKSLGALRLYQCFIERHRKNKNHSLLINQSLDWWRGFFGVGETLHITVITETHQPPLNKRTQWALTLTDAQTFINDTKALTCFFSPLSAMEQQVLADSLEKAERIFETPSKSPRFDLLIEKRRAKYPTFKKLHQNVLKKAFEELAHYFATNNLPSRASDDTSIAQPTAKVKTMKSEAKRKVGASTTTSYWVRFEMESSV